MTDPGLITWISWVIVLLMWHVVDAAVVQPALEQSDDGALDLLVAHELHLRLFATNPVRHVALVDGRNAVQTAVVPEKTKVYKVR